MSEPTNAEIISTWAAAPREIVESFGEEGDFTRQYLLNPTIFGLLGDVTGKAILDVGCGQGYLARLLARKGAIVTGVEERAVKQTYGHFIHRPLSTYLNSVIQEGCVLQQVIEPQLDEEVAQQARAERYMHVPGYIVIYATKSAY